MSGWKMQGCLNLHQMLVLVPVPTIPAMHATPGVRASTLCISLPNLCSALESLQLWCLWGRSRSCFPGVLGMLFCLLSSFSWPKRNTEVHFTLTSN